MKHIIILLFSFSIPIIGISQTQDTVGLPTDSTALLSVKDIRPLYEQLRKLPMETAEPYVRWIEQIIALKVQEYQIKSKKKKN